ncbi:MAG: hypothetical protein KVP17_004421 [Porospora cf. gigantea B]|nr:MAG: hypothetical protein KVP17_004421 [Porospora cf. gigantea B]
MHNLGKLFAWRRMKTTAKEVYNRCRACRISKATPAIGHHPERHLVPLPFFRVHADFSKLAEQQYLLIFVDAYSSWIEYRICKDKTAKQFVSALKEEILFRHGAPFTLVTDGGPEFTALDSISVMKQYCIHHDPTLPHGPQANGKAEKYLHLIKQGIQRRMPTNEELNTDTISQLTAEAVKDFRFKPVKRGASTPFQLVYGRLPRAPDDMIMQRLKAPAQSIELEVGDEVIIFNPNDISSAIKPQPRVHKIMTITGNAATVKSNDDDTTTIVSVNRLKRLPRPGPITVRISSGDEKLTEGMSDPTNGHPTETLDYVLI